MKTSQHEPAPSRGLSDQKKAAASSKTAAEGFAPLCAVAMKGVNARPRQKVRLFQMAALLPRKGPFAVGGGLGNAKLPRLCGLVRIRPRRGPLCAAKFLIYVGGAHRDRK
jgi:hypothetical protein